MDAVATEQPETTPSAGRRRWLPWVLGGIVVVVAGIAAAVVVSVRDASRPIPEFPSLAADPDPNLKGTVAYYATDGCIHLVAAAGAPDENVYCLPPEDTAKAPEKGKEVGPQLVWLPDGRLEITVFLMNPAFEGDPKEAPELLAGWQQILDVRTGEAIDVPAEDVPSQPKTGTEPSVDPEGRRIDVDSDSASGKVEVALEDAEGRRTLLSAQGPSKYQYSMRAFWAPTWDWVVGDDGRILVITTDDPASTRVLVSEPGLGRSGGTTEVAGFAVTEEDLLSS